MENHPLSSSKPSLGQAPVCYPGRKRQRTGLGAAEGHAPALSLPGSGQGAVSRYRGGVDYILIVYVYIDRIYIDYMYIWPRQRPREESVASVLSLVGPGVGGGLGYAVGEQVALWLTRRTKWLSTNLQERSKCAAQSGICAMKSLRCRCIKVS